MDDLNHQVTIGIPGDNQIRNYLIKKLKSTRDLGMLELSRRVEEEYDISKDQLRNIIDKLIEEKIIFINSDYRLQISHDMRFCEI